MLPCLQEDSHDFVMWYHDPAGAEQDLLGVVDVKAVHGSLALEPWRVGFEVCQWTFSGLWGFDGETTQTKQAFLYGAYIFHFRLFCAQFTHNHTLRRTVTPFSSRSHEFRVMNESRLVLYARLQRVTSGCGMLSPKKCFLLLTPSRNPVDHDIFGWHCIDTFV